MLSTAESGEIVIVGSIDQTKLKANKETEDRIRSLGEMKFTPEAVKQIEAILNQANRDQVLSQGQRGGTPFAPLKPSTVRQRRRKGYQAGPALVRSGKFIKAVSSGRAVVDSSGTQLRMVFAPASIVSMFPWFQEGTRKMSPRPFSVPISEDAKRIGQATGNGLPIFKK